MTKMQNGWDLLGDFMRELATAGRKSAIYRGQGRWDWDTVPSGLRAGQIGITSEERLYEWKWRAARFASPLPQDTIEWLILAQHYGLATPLLDWTTSPLVALYFACADQDQADQNGCVWISWMDQFRKADNTIMIDPFKPSRRKPFAINGVGRNLRSTAQDSILTLHTPLDIDKFHRKRLFPIAAQSKRGVLEQLEKLGISGDRLLYDITHLVTAMKAEYEGRRLHLLGEESE